MARKVLITKRNTHLLNSQSIEIDAETGKKYAIIPETVPMGVCYVDGDWLECYDWEDGEKLIILDVIAPDPEGIPVEQYFCHNEGRNSTGWVTEDQVRVTKEAS